MPVFPAGAARIVSPGRFSRKLTQFTFAQQRNISRRPSRIGSPPNKLQRRNPLRHYLAPPYFYTAELSRLTLSPLNRGGGWSSKHKARVSGSPHRMCRGG